MSLHEYRSASLLKSNGVKVPNGVVALTGDGALRAAESLGGNKIVVKAQVLTGGRGKGFLSSGLQGGVRLVSTPREAKEISQKMLNHYLVTKQTGKQGKKVGSVYIVEQKNVLKEAYLGIILDRESFSPLIIASSQGGMDIESVVQKDPSAIHKYKISINDVISDNLAMDIASKFGFSSQCQKSAAKTVQNLYEMFKKYDCTQIEINPLAETAEHEVFAIDCKLNFDDNAFYRQKEIFSWKDLTQEDQRELYASEYNLNFINLDGEIGNIVNGAGLAMATMDIIKYYGGEPANFLDCGGTATPETIEKAFELIFSDKKVKGVLVNIFGGIVRCDYVAEGLISSLKKFCSDIPVVTRLQGTNVEKAKEMILKSDLKLYAYDDVDIASKKLISLISS